MRSVADLQPIEHGLCERLGECAVWACPQTSVDDRKREFALSHHCNVRCERTDRGCSRQAEREGLVPEIGKDKGVVVYSVTVPSSSVSVQDWHSFVASANASMMVLASSSSVNCDAAEATNGPKSDSWNDDSASSCASTSLNGSWSSQNSSSVASSSSSGGDTDHPVGKSSNCTTTSLRSDEAPEVVVVSSSGSAVVVVVSIVCAWSSSSSPPHPARSSTALARTIELLLTAGPQGSEVSRQPAELTASGGKKTASNSTTSSRGVFRGNGPSRDGDRSLHATKSPRSEKSGGAPGMVKETLRHVRRTSGSTQ